MPRRALVCLSLLAALTGPAPAREAAPAAPAVSPGTWAEEPCPFTLEGGREVICGRLLVPENRERDGSRTIALHVRILRATEPAGLEPVVYLSGGPGQSMTFSTAADMGDWFAYLDGALSWSAGRDVILLAQRGIVVEGEGMECPALGDPRVYLGAAESPDRLTDWVGNVRREDRACREGLEAEGYDLSGYSTVEIARDVEALRLALGIPRWVVFGVSYGTRLGLTYLRAYPGGVAAAVLDSVFPPEVTDHWTDPAPFEAALDGLLDRCRADRDCNHAFPDLGARLDALLARLAAEPEPFWVEDADRGAGRLHFLLDDVTLLDMIFFNLYWVEDIETLPRAIDALERGNRDLFRRLVATPYVFDTLFLGWSWGMQAAVTCNDDFAFYEEAALRKAMERHPRLANWLATALALPPCAGWPVRPRDPGLASPPAVDVPVLLLAGELDPVTPPAYADRALPSLPAARRIVVPGVSHSTLDAADCAVRAAAEFLADPRGPVVEDCAESAGPVFDTR